MSDEFEAEYGDRLPFVQVPWWVTEGASGNAVKLYTILGRFADNHTGVAYPSRATLAARMGYAKVASIDPFIKELEELGAITVTRSMADGVKAKNRYRVYRNTPARVVPKNGPGGSPEKRPKGSPEKRPTVVPKNGHELRTNELITTELEPSLAEAAPQAPAAEPQPQLMNMPQTPAEQIKADSREVAKRLVEKHPGLKYPVVMKTAERMMKAHGVDGPTMWRTMEGIYSGGGHLTDTNISQVIEGIRDSTGRPTAPRVSAARQRTRDNLSLMTPDGGTVGGFNPFGEANSMTLELEA